MKRSLLIFASIIILSGALFLCQKYYNESCIGTYSVNYFGQQQTTDAFDRAPNIIELTPEEFICPDCERFFVVNASGENLETYPRSNWKYWGHNRFEIVCNLDSSKYIYLLNRSGNKLIGTVQFSTKNTAPRILTTDVELTALE